MEIRATVEAKSLWWMMDPDACNGSSQVKDGDSNKAFLEDDFPV
jgi:hypothetical protein